MVTGHLWHIILPLLGLWCFCLRRFSSFNHASGASSCSFRLFCFSASSCRTSLTWPTSPGSTSCWTQDRAAASPVILLHGDRGNSQPYVLPQVFSFQSSRWRTVVSVCDPGSRVPCLNEANRSGDLWFQTLLAALALMTVAPTAAHYTCSKTLECGAQRKFVEQTAVVTGPKCGQGCIVRKHGRRLLCFHCSNTAPLTSSEHLLYCALCIYMVFAGCGSHQVASNAFTFKKILPITKIQKPPSGCHEAMSVCWQSPEQSRHKQMWCKHWERTRYSRGKHRKAMPHD